jgi:hypothetical protein
MSFIGLIVQPRIVALTFIGGRKTYKKVFVFGIWTTFYDVNKILKIRQMAASPPKKIISKHLLYATLRYSLLIDAACTRCSTLRYAMLICAMHVIYGIL